MPNPGMTAEQAKAIMAAITSAVQEGHPPPNRPVWKKPNAKRIGIVKLGYKIWSVNTAYLTAAQIAGEPDWDAIVSGDKPRHRVKATSVPFEVPELPSPDEPIDELIERRSKAFSRLKEAREAREVIPVQVNVRGPYGILHMGDPHVDDDGCDWPTLRHHLDLINGTPALFGASIGDQSNNWVGRLARLYANQGTGARDAWRMVEWFIRSVRWLYMLGGNHDVWSGHGDPIQWMAAQSGALYQWHGVRLALISPGGSETRINARHDFAGTSQWNGAHAPAKAARLGWERDHLYTCGHRHMAAENTLIFNNGNHVARAVRVGTYKVFDDYADAKGFPHENMPAALTVINPHPRTEAGRVSVFWDVDEGADFLRYLRKDAE